MDFSVSETSKAEAHTQKEKAEWQDIGPTMFTSLPTSFFFLEFFFDLQDQMLMHSLWLLSLWGGSSLGCLKTLLDIKHFATLQTLFCAGNVSLYTFSRISLEVKKHKHTKFTHNLLIPY